MIDNTEQITQNIGTLGRNHRFSSEFIQEAIDNHAY